MTDPTVERPAAVAVPIKPLFSDAERSALVGFLAGYSGQTRVAYTLDLRQYTSWCASHGLHLFQAKRADIECFARDLEARGRTRATVARRLSTVAGFYRYAVEEDLLDHSPAVHVRRPRLDYESHATALDRNEIGALLVVAGLGTAAGHALISLLALNGLRISEALGANIEALGTERGHRTLTVQRKGGKIVTIPLAPRTARAIDLAIGERIDGPIFLRADGQRMDRHAAGRIVHRAAYKAGSATRRSARTPCGTRSSPPRSTLASRCATCRKPPRTQTHARLSATTAPARHWTDTPPTSLPPTLPAPRGEPPVNQPSRPVGA